MDGNSPAIREQDLAATLPVHPDPVPGNPPETYICHILYHGPELWCQKRITVPGRYCQWGESARLHPAGGDAAGYGPASGGASGVRMEAALYGVRDGSTRVG